MGLTAAIGRLAYSLLFALSHLIALLSGHTKLHSARFAAVHELAGLIETDLHKEANLILGTTHLGDALAVRANRARRELGNLLIVAPTRGGKGLLATAQLLTWKHSVVVNDIKGDLFLQTAGYRSTLGPVFVIDPTGVGHTLDPLYSKRTEDEL
jgi:type IV secretion system protein VirD4